MTKDETIKLIAAALKEQGILTPNILAYAIATMEHETGRRFAPVREGFAKDDRGAIAAVTQLYNEKRIKNMQDSIIYGWYQWYQSISPY
jgi:hypothetical protein